MTVVQALRRPDVDDHVAAAELEQEALVWVPGWDHSAALLVSTVNELARRIAQLRVSDLSDGDDHFGGLEQQVSGGPWAQTLRQSDHWWVEVHPYAWDGTQDAFVYEEAKLASPEAAAELMWRWVQRRLLIAGADLDPIVHPFDGLPW